MTEPGSKLRLRIDGHSNDRGETPTYNLVGSHIDCTVLEPSGSGPLPQPEIGWLDPPLPLLPHDGRKEFFPRTGPELEDAARQLRPGFGDRIYLQRGMVYLIQNSLKLPGGLGSGAPTLLSATGDLSLLPPVIQYAYGHYSHRSIIQANTDDDYVRISDIHFKGPDDIYAQRGSGVSHLRGSYWTYEGCIFEGLGIGLNFTGNAWKKHCLVHRCVFLDSVSFKKSDSDEWAWNHSHGLFAKYTDYLTVSECIFHRCGWHPDHPHRWGQNHNLYVNNVKDKSPNTNFKLIGNVSLEPANIGFMCRAAGIIEDNLVGFAPTGISGGTEKVADLRTGRFIHNVVTNTIRIPGSSGVPTLGWSYLMGDISSLEFQANLAVAPERDCRGFMFRQRLANSKIAVNLSHGHDIAVSMNMEDWSGMRVEDNNFMPTPEGIPYKRVNGPEISPQQLLPRGVVSPGFDLLSYRPDFIQRVRQQRRGNWDSAYTAGLANRAFRDAYTLV